MAVKIAINGFGRIGRQSYKAVLDYYPEELEVVAINDLMDAETNAHLLKYDSNYGRFPGEVEVKGDNIVVNGKELKVFAQRDWKQLPWKDLGVEIVFESTGVGKTRAMAGAHIEAGAKKVIISAPPRDKDIATLLLGVNEEVYDPAKHDLISNASCTTNCVATIAKVLNDEFGIVNGFMTTIHSYTNDQSILDLAHKDLRRARAAALNIIPTTTGAARALGLVIPELEGKLDGVALRVPTPTVSIVDLVVNVKKEVSVQKVNDAFRAAAAGRMKNTLKVCEEPLVSMDFKGDPASSIVDALSTMVVGNTVKVFSWYDNEWGYSCRMAELAAYMVKKGL